MKLFHIATTAPSLSFVQGQVGFMKKQGLEVHVVSSPDSKLEKFGQMEGVTTHAVEMRRKISPWRDLISITQLFCLFRRERPDIVQTHTPKASLVAGVAAWLACVPCRIFTLHGLPHTTASGLSGLILKLSTKLPCLLATKILSVSKSVGAAAVEAGLCKQEELILLRQGSSDGVNAQVKFRPDSSLGVQFRATLGVAVGDLVIGFAGRLVRDKGVCDLAQAWQSIRQEFLNSYLVLAGPIEARDAVPAEVISQFKADPRVRLLGNLEDMQSFYASLDLFVLPTYREGLGLVLLEAAAMEVPSVATRTVGCVDAVSDKRTGFLVEAGNARELEMAIVTYLRNPELRAAHGKYARSRVIEDFRPEPLWADTLQLYCRALGKSDSASRIPISSPVRDEGGKDDEFSAVRFSKLES